jgi:hypothetical protein
VDADADRQLHPRAPRQTSIECPHGFHNPQTSADGAAGIVFMRLGVAKVHQQPIPEILGNMAVKALNDCGGGLLVGADDLSPIFWVELASQQGRVDQVTKEHGELAPFRLWRRGGREQRCRLRHRRLQRGRREYGLRRGWGRGDRHRRATCPDQDAPCFVRSQALALDELVFERFQVHGIELKLQLEGAIRQAPPLA